jgi:hypothetical protein
MFVTVHHDRFTRLASMSPLREHLYEWEGMMPKFLIEVPHDPDTQGCARVVQVFLTSGSHFLTNAQWGCMAGEHTAWMIVEVDSKEEARSIVPPAFRAHARIVGLNQFSLEQVDALMVRHGAQHSGSEPVSSAKEP